MLVLFAYAASLVAILPLAQTAASSRASVGCQHSHDAAQSSAATEAGATIDGAVCCSPNADEAPTNSKGACGESCCDDGCANGAFCGCGTLSLPPSPIAGVHKSPCHSPGFPERSSSPLPGALTIPALPDAARMAFTTAPVATVRIVLAELRDQTAPLPAVPPPREAFDTATA